MFGFMEQVTLNDGTRRRGSRVASTTIRYVCSLCLSIRSQYPHVYIILMIIQNVTTAKELL